MDKIILDFIEEINNQHKYLVEIDDVLLKEKNDYEEKNGLAINIIKLLNVVMYRNEIKKDGDTDNLIEAEKRIDELTELLKKNYNAKVKIQDNGVKIDNVETKKFETYITFAKYMQLLNKRAVFLSSTYVNIISIVEKFFANIIRYIYNNNPQKFNKLTETISLSELYQYEDLSELREKIVEKHVETITRKNFKEWLDYLAKQGINIDSQIDKKLKERAYEAFLRRNIFVHNGGIINNTYLINANPEFHSFVKDQRIVLDIDYISHIIKVFKKIFILISIDVWYTVKRKDEKREYKFIDMTYSLLSDEDYYCAELVANKFLSIKGISELSKIYVSINKMIAQKNSGKQWKKIRKELLESDYSIYEPKVQMAKYALLDEYDKVNELLHELLTHRQITSFDICAFPLLKGFRKTKYFSDLLDEYNDIQSFYAEIFDQKEKEGMILDDLFYSLLSDGDE